MKIRDSISFFLLIGILSALYFLFLYRFYIDIYDVPDYFLYNKLGDTTKDSFSSLFVRISKLNITYPFFFHITSLFALTFTLFTLNFLFHLKSKSYIDSLLFLVLSFSSGIWYYFFGKTYYDFPFTAFTFSLALIALYSSCVNNEKPSIFSALNIKILSKRPLLLFYFLSGLCLSWKLYNIFLIFGVFVLVIFNYKKFFSYKSSISPFGAVYVISFFVGYIFGNYTLLTSFIDTLAGLRGYPASSNIYTHFFNAKLKVWDHVSLVPFNTGNLNIVSLFIILIVLPLYIKNKIYLKINIFLIVMYVVFISFFSPGYPWHGFPFGLFIIIVFGVLLLETVNLNKKNKLFFRSFALTAALLQSYNNFFNYIPNEILWFNAAEDAKNLLISKRTEINNRITSISKNLDACFDIDIRYKYRKITPTGKVETPLMNEYPASYFWVTSSFFWVTSPNGYKYISTETCTKDKKYSIFIEPYSLYEIPSYAKMDSMKIIHSDSFDGWRIGWYDQPITTPKDNTKRDRICKILRDGIYGRVFSSYPHFCQTN